VRGLDGHARIFIGSSSEGKTATEATASALEAAGMRPLLWSDFFKTRDLPLQELDRRMADADGAILVGSADDRLVSRGKEFDQMRDNVLLEYGLFAGHLGRHRCILLMPDHPRFRIPSDFLGVAGFELYTGQTLNAVLKRVLERLQAAFAADGFEPPSLQERCRRLLLLSGWLRGEIAKIRLDISGQSLKEQVGQKIEAIFCFLKEDIDELGLREEANALGKSVRMSLDTLSYVVRESEYLFKRELRLFLSYSARPRPNHYVKYEIEKILGYEWVTSVRRSRSCHYRYRSEYGRRVYSEWYRGAIDMLAFSHRSNDRTISELERWYQNWVPNILNMLDTIEKTVHKQIFGHL
jgi:hypothetical protein